MGSPRPAASVPLEDGPLTGWDPAWRRALGIGALALAYWGAARLPLATGLAFQAYLFWPAAAVAHTALFILGPEAAFGLLLGSLALNLTSWLPWPQALAMTGLQTLEPLLAWRLLVALGCPHPDPRRTWDLVRWWGIASAVNALFSAGAGTLVVGSALPGGFQAPLATALSWFLGDHAALLCLGPALLLFLAPVPATPAGPPPRRPIRWAEPLALAAAGLTLLILGAFRSGLSRDVRLALQFALVLPVLWMALRLGPRRTALGIVLLSFAFLASLWVRGQALPEEAFRFTQLFLLVLALAAHLTAATTEEARLARHALGVQDLRAQRMEAVGSLAGGLVHEFANELTVLLGTLDRLREQLAGASGAGALLNRLDASASALSGTVHQLRGLSHQAPLQVSRLPLEDALAPFLQGMAQLPDRITFTASLASDLLVSLDPDRLCHALQVLVTNSLEAIEGRGTIRLASRREGETVLLALEDSGHGMSPEVLQRACDPFFSTKPVGSGRGLGLSLAFSLVRQMGGSLSLESAPGRGTRAELRFPLAEAREAADPVPAAVPHQRCILLADDEAAIRDLARECLEAEGFAVRTAADGLEALEAFEADPQGWDLAILDLVMPRMHGSEVLTRIHARRPDLPVLLISGYSAESRPELLLGPHRRFLAKPFRIRELLTILGELGLQPPRA